jgi:predicted cupin superfamily sugar epimerase
VFHFYMGVAVQMLQLRPDGTGRELTLGPNLSAGEVPQVIVPAGVWQGTRLLGDTGFALLGCTVAPGFDYADYTSASRAELVAKWPAFADAIQRLTPRG